MARKRSLDEGPVLREQIMQRASELFYERGFGSTSIRDIAAAAQISSSTLYHHFENKQEVLHAIVSRFMGDFVGAAEQLLADKSRPPVERLADVVRAHIELSDDRRPELLVGNPIRNALEPGQRREGLLLQNRYHELVRELIEEGCVRGDFRCPDVDITTFALLDMLNGVREWFSADGRLDRERIVGLYQDAALRLVAAAPDGVPPLRAAGGRS